MESWSSREEKGLVCNDESLTLPLEGPDEISPTHSRAISLTLWNHPFPSTTPYAILSPSQFLPGSVFPPRRKHSALRSVSFRSSPLVAPPLRISNESCLNAQTKRQIKGTAGSACTTARAKVERREKETRGKAGIGNVYYYHRGPPSSSLLLHSIEYNLAIVEINFRVNRPSPPHRVQRTRVLRRVHASAARTPACARPVSPMATLDRRSTKWYLCRYNPSRASPARDICTYVRKVFFFMDLIEISTNYVTRI